MKLGASKHWSEILKTMTSETELNANAIIEYFHPLYEFLKKENIRLKLEHDTREKLDSYNIEAIDQCRIFQLAEWDFITDVNNKSKQEARAQAIVNLAAFRQTAYRNSFQGIAPEDIDDEYLRRQLQYISKLGINFLNESRLNEWSRLKSNMENIYSTAVFCPFEKQYCDLKTEGITLEPGKYEKVVCYFGLHVYFLQYLDITRIMATSINYKELEYTWTNWFNTVGAPMRKDFKKYVDISNEAAQMNGVSDYGELWRSMYDDPNFIQNMMVIWDKVEPLYSRLHEYTRHKLLEIYAGEVNEDDPLIPAHLLGNMWAQSWVNLFDRIKPFKNATDLNITERLKVCVLYISLVISIPVDI